MAPAPSIAAQQAWGIAEHEPSKLYKRNRSMLKASHTVQHEFAATKHKGLPEHVKNRLKAALAKKG